METIAKKISCVLLIVVSFLASGCKKNDVPYDDYPDSKISYTVHSEGKSYYFPDTTYTFVSNFEDKSVFFYHDTKNGQKFVGMSIGYLGAFGWYVGDFLIPTSEPEVGFYTYTGSSILAGEEIGHYYIQQFLDGKNFGYQGKNSSDYIKISITKKYSLLHYVYGQNDIPTIYVDGSFECIYSHFIGDISPSTHISIKGFFTSIPVQ